MSNILEFKRPKLTEKHKGNTLCKSNFHQWKVITNNKFDVKKGQLVTVYRCTRCGEEKTTAH